MIGNERLTGFVNSLYKGNTPFLDALERDARNDDIPIIRKETQAFLRFVLKERDPRSILEIGAAIGFSAIFMAEYSSPGCRISTIENYEKRIVPAEKNIEKSGYSDRITLIRGDAAEILPTLQESFDMIFIDAAKAQYPFYLKEADRLLKPGGLILADNCLQDGDILESKFAVERRNRTIHKRMREFLKEITASDHFTAAVLPIGDGIAVAVKDK